MPNRTIYVADPLLAQLEAEAAAAETTPGKLLVRLGLAALVGAEPNRPTLAARVIAALNDGASTIEEVAKAIGEKPDLVRTTLHNLAQVRDDETDRPIVKLDDVSGRAVWQLAAA